MLVMGRKNLSNLGRNDGTKPKVRLKLPAPSGAVKKSQSKVDK